MIQPLLVIFLILPIILGILSVNTEGERISIIETIKNSFLREPIKAGLDAYVGDVDNGNQTETIDPRSTFIQLPEESEKSIDKVTSMVSDGITFLFLQSREFGIWMGMATAPFHYLLAVVIGFSFLFPTVWLFMVGFFYIVITERKEIRKEFHDMRVRKKVV